MIYFDNAATTPPDSAALAETVKFYTENYFNPSARYSGGFAVRRAVEDARAALLSHIADPSLYELEFTSGGTEADNHAVFSGARRGNAVTTAGEHAAVYESALHLRDGGVEARFAAIRADGSVDPAALLEAVDEKTTLVSVVHVNNETGAVNDIAALAKAVKAKNPRCLFHSDGVQAFGKLPFRLTKDIDLYSVSAHKLGGLKGTGALIRRKGVSLPPLLWGGGQENGRRSGTENVFGILDFSYAAERRFSSLQAAYRRLASERERFLSLLDASVFTRISPKDGSPYLVTVYASGIRGEVLQRMLSDRGLIVGTGSACSSKKPYSRILEATGQYDRAALGGVLRMSFSADTTKEEIEEGARLINLAAREYQNRI